MRRAFHLFASHLFAGHLFMGPVNAMLGTLWAIMRRRDGNVALLFGLAAVPVIVAAGIAMDVTRIYMVKTRLGAALDAAALDVGSQSNQTSSALTTALNNYFYNNYCRSVAGGTTVTSCNSTVAGETVTSLGVAPNSPDPITGATVTFQATAQLNTIFMPILSVLPGFSSYQVNPVNVTVTSQITKFPGMEVAVVLDNTGSMLCNGAATGPLYSPCGSVDSTNPPSSGGNCANIATSTNPSRICTLIKAAQDFVQTLQIAAPGPKSLYMSIVPYVTTVNVGQAFNCTTNSTNCTNITQDSCSGDFTDDRGNVIYDGTASPAATSSATDKQTSLKGTLGAKTTTITSVSPNTSGLLTGMTLSGNSNIPSGAYITAVNSTTQITISTKTTNSSTLTSQSFKVNEGGASTTSGSTTVTFTSNPSSTLAAGMVVTGNGIPAYDAIQTVNSTTSITLCKAATATASYQNFSFYNPVNYDAAYNNAAPAMTSSGAVTAGWGGCVVEPTSSDENTGVSGVIPYGSSGADPDTKAPIAGMQWYPLWWLSSSDPNSFSGNVNSWSSQTSGSIKYQSYAGEAQGSVGSYDSLPGPNQGCPAPMLSLQDITDQSSGGGLAQVNQAINNMWPRDADGTQVHIGMAWGWRTLDPNGPFTANNGHPLTYSTATNTGWKKIVVLMTDGTEEWVTGGEYTGLGPITDGKINTTNYNNAPANLATRLATLCTNMNNAGIIVYTIGLGYDGQNNSQLQNCASNPNYYYKATPATIDTAFQSIAASIIHLRLSQ